MEQAYVVTAFQTVIQRRLFVPLYGCAFLVLASLSACAQKQAALDCASLDRLLVTQVEAISAAQLQLDRGSSVQEIQQGLGAVVAMAALVIDQCHEANYLDAGQNCIKVAAFGRARDLAALLRALHGADLAEGARARVFVGRMLAAGRDEASKPVSGLKCMDGT